jgi:hypothetical protein
MSTRDVDGLIKILGKNSSCFEKHYRIGSTPEVRLIEYEEK